MTYALDAIRVAATDSLHKNCNLWLIKHSKSWTHTSCGTCLSRRFNSDNMEESSQPLSV